MRVDPVVFEIYKIVRAKNVSVASLYQGYGFQEVLYLVALLIFSFPSLLILTEYDRMMHLSGCGCRVVVVVNACRLHVFFSAKNVSVS